MFRGVFGFFAFMFKGGMYMSSQPTQIGLDTIHPKWLERIAEQLKGLNYGSLTITIHDGHIVQLERTERTRFELEGAKERRQSR